MKKIVTLFILTLVLSISLIGCSSLENAKAGNEMVYVYLEPNLKLEDVDWEETNLWYLLRPMEENESAVIHTYNAKYSALTDEEFEMVKFVETKLNDNDMSEYQAFKSDGYRIEEYLEYKETGVKLSIEELEERRKNKSNNKEESESETVTIEVVNTYESASKSNSEKETDEYGYSIK